MADSKKYNGSTWVHSLRKLTTATEAVENPLYSDGTAITSYTIKGNTEYTGTPSPQNPVMPNGVGERTENLWDGNYEVGGYNNSTGAKDDTLTNLWRNTNYIAVEPNTTYTFSTNNDVWAFSRYFYYDLTKVLISTDTGTSTITTPANCHYLCFQSGNLKNVYPDGLYNSMLNTGSTAKTYEPYGYKIPISSGGVTTNIYLGSTQTTRQIGKITFDGSDDEQWSERQSPANSYVISIPAERVDGICTHLTQVSAAASLVDDTMYVGATAMSMKVGGISSLTDFKAWLAANKPTVWYVLATPETAAVNEPLMKIGDYADTLSNAASIPTTEGANSITVDTTVQPSEFTATWTGWHDATVKEWDGSQWQ